MLSESFITDFINLKIMPTGCFSLLMSGCVLNLDLNRLRSTLAELVSTEIYWKTQAWPPKLTDYWFCPGLPLFTEAPAHFKRVFVDEADIFTLQLLGVNGSWLCKDRHTSGLRLHHMISSKTYNRQLSSMNQLKQTHQVQKSFFWTFLMDVQLRSHWV